MQNPPSNSDQPFLSNLWAMLAPFLGCLALAGLLQVIIPQVVDGYYVGVLIRICVFIIAAVSLNIVNGFTGQFSLGHAGFMTIGAYAGGVISYSAMLMMKDAHPQAWEMSKVPIMLAGCGVGGLVASVLGYIVGLPSLRLRGDYLALVTLGFGEIIRVVLSLTKDQIESAQEVHKLGLLAMVRLNGSRGFSTPPALVNLFWAVLFAGITCVLVYRLKRSSTGRAMLAIREDEIAARAMGISLTKYKVRAFVLAAFFAGIAGGLYAHTGVNPSPTDAGFQRSFELVILVVLGGMGSISGVVIAAIALIALPELLRDLQQYRLIVYALLLIFTMILRPQGLLGLKEIWELKPFGRKV